VARNRQRAKQRQQQRREERLRERRAQQADGKADGDDPAEVGRVAGETGAPPENLGRSDASLEADASVDDDAGAVRDDEGEVVEAPRGGPDRARDLSPEEEEELFLDEEDFEVDQDELAEAEKAETAYAPRGKRGGRDRPAGPGEPTRATGLARVVAFLRACWAELQRVQWPDRKQTTQLTAIVLVFIIIMGGYLGLLDAIVSRVVQEIL
jgi:preprotein translocase subunit SecE